MYKAPGNGSLHRGEKSLLLIPYGIFDPPCSIEPLESRAVGMVFPEDDFSAHVDPDSS